MINQRENPPSNQVKPIQETEDGKQDWLDQEKEVAYGKLDDIFSRIHQEKDQEGARELLLDLINGGLEKTGGQLLEAELLQSADFKRVNSVSATKIAGQEINRPIFVFQTIESFKEFYYKLTGSKDPRGPSCVGSRGFVTDLDIGAEGNKARIKLIVSAPDKDHIGHEIRHSIDPNLGKREGYNVILEELFAYYWESIVEGRHERGADKLWDDLRASIWDSENGYYAEYSEEAKEKITFEEYGKLTGRIVEAVKKIQAENKDHIETQRQIVNLKNLEELFALVR